MSNSLTEAENISGNYKWERFPVSLMQSAGVCAEWCQIRASAINHPDTKFMIQNYSSQRRPAVISTEHRCTNITFNARENREVETVGFIITLIVFRWCLFCFWWSRDGITARVGTGAGSGLVALGYSCPPANQTSAREWARVCVRVSAVWQYNYEARCRLSQAYNRRLSIVRQWEFINVQTMTHTHTHT